LRSVESAGWRSIRRFYLRRAFRTFPSYYLVLSFLVLTTPLTAIQSHNLVFAYTYLTNYASNGRENVVMPWGWSLGLEEQFYLTVPLLFLVLRKLRGDRARLALLGALWSSAPLMRLFTYLHYGNGIPAAQFDTIYFRTHTRSDTLVAGLILAYVHARWQAPITRWLESPFSRAVLALPPLLCLWVLLHPWLFRARPRLGEVFFWGTFTSVMYVAWGLLILHGGDGWVRRALSAPLFRRIATLGYGVYLVHIPVCDKLVAPGAVALLKHWHCSSEAVWVFTLVAALLGSIGLSYVLHVVVEKPSLRLRDRLAG
jgi:peptidoglycan/LPS O-acetylase OafA/YrhL